ncbi:hypothetical protein SETIT_5G391400v2 [Setaria italica]|uniref:Uncharacterized protein n=2 Tax=Setaria italica TaxID=4555 RepID=A0A368RF99_SETIT|nr:hypothetical protein SETIT_5G391400v2 [Setaria italica]
MGFTNLSGPLVIGPTFSPGVGWRTQEESSTSRGVSFSLFFLSLEQEENNPLQKIIKKKKIDKEEKKERCPGGGGGVEREEVVAWACRRGGGGVVAMEKGAGTRRRRLVERGSDRLAFITGQTRSLSCDPIPGSPSSYDSASPLQSEQQQNEGAFGGEKFSDRTQLQKSVPRASIHQEPRARTLSYDDLVPEFKRADTPQEIKAKPLSYEDELFHKFKTGSASAVPEIQPVNETPSVRGKNETPSHRPDQETLSKKTSHEEAPSVQPIREVEIRPRSAPPSQPNQAHDAGWSVETLKELMNFTPQEITKAISATESNRLLASIAIAFLVVLSNWGLDIGGAITRVLVGTRPLLFLIITNITIVLTLLMENKDPNARGRPVGPNLGSADSLGQMLEIGLLLQKALGALLIDCSVCAVIMICFLGF